MTALAFYRAVSNTKELIIMGISREAMRSLVVACWESDAGLVASLCALDALSNIGELLLQSLRRKL